MDGCVLFLKRCYIIFLEQPLVSSLILVMGISFPKHATYRSYLFSHVCLTSGSLNGIVEIFLSNLQLLPPKCLIINWVAKVK